MQDLSSLGLEARTSASNSRGESRTEIRLVSNGSFVAWFQSNERVSNGELVMSTSTQIILRNELNEAQRIAVREWLRERVLAAL